MATRKTNYRYGAKTNAILNMSGIFDRSNFGPDLDATAALLRLLARRGKIRRLTAYRNAPNLYSK
jgi:hypothetical protein